MTRTEPPKIKHFNSVEAAKILGVNVSTIKRWTESGELSCLRTPGGHRKFLPEHLSEFMEQHRRKKARVPLLPIEKSDDVELTAKIFSDDTAYLQQQILEQAKLGAIERVLFILSGMISIPKPLHEIYDHLITPVLHRLGELWENEKLSIVEEHLASQTIRLALDRLQALITIPREKIGTALCMNLSNELHDIPLQMVGHILEKRGYRVLFSGQMTPFMGLEDVFNKVKVDRIYISSTVIPDAVSARQEFRQVFELAGANGIPVFIGGRGLDQVKLDLPEWVTRLFTFEEVAKS
ncbi:MAG: hypothetical protein Kow0037_29110 [Calditrichia bacterium]